MEIPKLWVYELIRLGQRYTEHYLNFYLSKNKITYEDESYESGECTEEYKTISQTKVKTIEQFHLGSYPNEKWINLRFIYVAPDDIGGINDYNWFGIELISENEIECMDHPIRIDEISIEEVDFCTLDPCVRTDGPVIASAPFPYNSGYGPFAVEFLDNIESAENIRIHNFWGQLIKSLPSVYTTNGILNPIFWDGTQGSGSQQAANNAVYIWSMDLTNECGTSTYSERFTKYFNVTEPIPTFPDYNAISTPRPCCSDLPDILIDYDLYGSGLIEFSAVDDITLQNMTVESSVESLILQAGNSITFLPGTIIEQGAVVKAMIQSCSED